MSRRPPIEGWEEVATPGSRLEADVLKAALETAAIPVVERAEAYGQIVGITVGDLGAISLFVPADRVAEARELLSDQRAIDFPQGD